MAETATKLPIKTQDKSKEAAVPAGKSREWHPFEALRKQVDHLFEDFDKGFLPNTFTRPLFDIEPFWRREFTLNAIPAIDIVEHDKDFQITAELPGMDESNIEVKLSNGMLSITGEKKEEKEENKKNYHLSERHYGAFERSFRLPESVEADKIEAHFKDGVLTVSLPKDGEAQKSAKKIAIKTN
ncbi:Hsp20/alpha crystallin family protein [Nevskia soli]|uniref:Hsp20/alpha crystallin family protein n=1 Tax=Nevskia soli TaxID=418856 RepID=UPI0004A7702F|nr:Hsp20/alpha crystallin family protein [Nevskia soli]